MPSLPFCDGYSAVFMIKGRVLADFSKESILYGNSYYKKEEGRPYSVSQVCTQKILEMDTKRVDSQKVSVSAPALQNCVHEYY